VASKRASAASAGCDSARFFFLLISPITPIEHFIDAAETTCTPTKLYALRLTIACRTVGGKRHHREDSVAKIKKIERLPVPNTDEPPPLRVLDVEGLKLWRRIWALDGHWISVAADIDYVTLLCEAVDERVALRQRVLADGDWRDRVALRALDDQIDRMMGALGLNPTDPAKPDVGEAPKGRLADLRASRASRALTSGFGPL
jgi:hypothetical protein